jgi:hypothetical protein
MTRALACACLALAGFLAVGVLACILVGADLDAIRVIVLMFVAAVLALVGIGLGIMGGSDV